MPLIQWLDAQQTRVMAELDQLAERAERLADQWRGEPDGPDQRLSGPDGYPDAPTC